MNTYTVYCLVLHVDILCLLQKRAPSTLVATAPLVSTATRGSSAHVRVATAETRAHTLRMRAWWGNTARTVARVCTWARRPCVCAGRASAGEGVRDTWPHVSGVY